MEPRKAREDFESQDNEFFFLSSSLDFVLWTTGSQGSDMSTFKKTTLATWKMDYRRTRVEAEIPWRYPA
jgi:hypothetical protein